MKSPIISKEKIKTLFGEFVNLKKDNVLIQSALGINKDFHKK